MTGFWFGFFISSVGFLLIGLVLFGLFCLLACFLIL